MNAATKAQILYAFGTLLNSLCAAVTVTAMQPNPPMMEICIVWLFCQGLAFGFAEAVYRWSKDDD